MRIARGNRIRSTWQSIRLFSMVLAATAALLSLHKNLQYIAAAEPESDPALETQPELPTFTPGTPSPLTPGDVKPSDATLKWTSTGVGTLEDTYDIRITQTPEVDEETGELLTPTAVADDLTAAQFDATTFGEGMYYWQVRSCGVLSCNGWSSAWTLAIDATAPVPTVEVTSSDYSRTVSLAGTAEASSRVDVTVGESTCTTTADNVGNWSCLFDEEFDYGEYTLSAVATDKVGNVSAATNLEFAVKELFVAPLITTEELPATLDIVPADETPENNVFKQPVTSVIDVVNTGSTEETEQIATGPAVLSTDGGIVQSSESGWQVLGLPWFIWLGSVAGITGGWWMFGAPVPRRLGTLLSL